MLDIKTMKNSRKFINLSYFKRMLDIKGYEEHLEVLLIMFLKITHEMLQGTFMRSRLNTWYIPVPR